MNSLDNMKTRVNYSGGSNQVSRMNNNKLKSLKKALIYSYQSATAQLADGRKFRCLINPDKLKEDYDDKIISIPFEDICLNPDVSAVEKTTDGIETIGMKAGDIFTWVENNTDWLVYLQRLEETAYFRAEIRRCQYEITIDDTSYKVYTKGPSETGLVWNIKSGVIWNDLNYTLEMYIKKDELTEKFMHRFGIVTINNKPWEIQAIDNISVDGIIVVALKETYQNTIQDEEEKEKEPTPISQYIEGDTLVYPYDEKTYKTIGLTGGTWSVNNSKVVITAQTDTTAELYINTSYSGSFVLTYTRDGEDDITLSVTIDSL